MCRPFIYLVLLCMFLGLVGCGSTEPKNSGLEVGKSWETPAKEKERITVALNEAPSKEDTVAASDESATVKSNMTLPQPKPSINPSIVIGPVTSNDLLANRVFEPEEGKGLAITPDPVEKNQTDKPFTEQNADDVINNIIWKIQSEVSNQQVQTEAKIPEGQDPSLAKDALEAAFELLAQKAKPESTKSPKPEWSVKKVEGVTRIALLLPVTGFYKHMGEELRKGAELALFSARNPKVELMVFDTMGGQRGRSAATEAVAAESDIIIGPLFSDAVAEAQVVTKAANIPMLLLSNNSLVAARGSWLMGYLPEQQLDLLLGHAISDGKRHFGIIAEDSDFGKRLALHAQRRLSQLSLPARDSIVLKDAVLESENLLKRAVRDFSRYVPPSEKELTPKKPTVFDALIFAGGAEFALRIAPVLAYYDLGSDTIMYLGNAQWNQQRILSEPSLQNGLFAFRPSNTDDQFVKKWTTIWPDRPGLLSRLSFDAVALAEVLASKDRSSWQQDLLSSVGFNGFSGAFRFLPGGGNVRAFELRQIADGTVKLLKPAPDKI